MSCSSQSKYPPKTGDYCRTEIEQMVKVLLENKDLFVKDQELVFEKMAAALEGKRNQRNMKDWFLNTQKILETENRWTNVIKNNITDEQKVQLKEILLAKETIVHSSLHPSAPPIYQETVGESDYETSEGPIAREIPIDSTISQKKSSGCFGCWTRRSKQGYESS